VRVLWITLRLLLGSGNNPDVIFCDQVPFTVPLLRLTGARVLFYIHFPDKLLSQRGSILKTLYRIPLDYLEERTTRAADLLVCNSRFTASIVRQHFPSILDELAILYPTTTLTRADANQGNVALPENVEQHMDHYLLSINRYEEKKNHELAVRALATLLQPNHANYVGERETAHVHLVIAGGYDDRVPENRLVFESLTRLVQQLNLEDHVTMLRSVSGAVKNALLSHCVAIVYTPHNEHFGIVPVEAMALARPVIAVNTGGPTETVAHGVTGWLCDNVPDAFGAPMQCLLLDRVLGKRMGEAGVRRVDDLFGFKAFSRQLNAMVDKLVE
jgi:alpha-1,3/alpha-1,6-mannosyltransferase